MLTKNINCILDNDIYKIYFNNQKLTNSKYYQDNINVLNYIMNEKSNNLVINYKNRYLSSIYLLHIAIKSYLNNTLNQKNHIFKNINKGSLLFYEGKIVIFNDKNEQYITLGYKDKTDKEYLPIKYTYKLIPYNGDSKVKSMGPGSKSKSFKTKKVLSEFNLANLDDMTGIISDSTLIILPCKDDIYNLVNNIEIRSSSSTFKFTDLFPCSYISSTGTEFNFPGNYSSQNNLLKFTTNISSAFEIIRSDKSIKNVIIMNDYPIYKYINDLERILNRKRIESVNIITSNSNISNILDLPNIEYINIYSWSKDILLTYFDDFKNQSQKEQLWMGQLINKNISSILIDSDLSNLIPATRKLLYYISKYDFDVSIKNLFIMSSYSLLKILESTPFPLKLLEENISILNLNLMPPVQRLNNIKSLIENINVDTELHILFNDIISNFEKIIDNLYDSNAKFNTLMKIISSYKHKEFTTDTPVILLQKQYESIILKKILKSRNINLQVISAEKFNDSKIFKNVLIFGFYDLKYIDILNQNNLISVTLYLYDSEQSKYNYYINKINSVKNDIERKNKIYDLLEINPVGSVLEVNNLDASTINYGNTDDSINEYIANYKFDINISEVISSISTKQNTNNHKKEHVTSFIISNNDEYILCTKNASTYTIDWANKKVKKKKLSDAQVSDWFLFVDDYLNEEGELILNVIQKLLELNLLDPSYLDYYKLTELWKSELKNYISCNNLSYSDISNSLAVLGENINPITIRNWVTNKRLIGPLYLKTFESIFKVMNSTLNYKQVHSATKNIRSLHTQIKKSIDKFVCDNFFSKKSDIIKDEKSKVVLSLLGNTNDYVTPVQIKEIHNCDKYVTRNLVNRVLDLYNIY